VLKNYHQGRNYIVLTLRTAHVESLANRLKEMVPDVITLMGGMGKKATRDIFQRIADMPADRNIILVATGLFLEKASTNPVSTYSFWQCRFDKDSFLPVFNQDINSAKRKSIIVSPFVRKMRTLQMIKHLKVALEKQVRVLIVNRPKEDFKPKDHATIQRTLDLLTDCGTSVVF
jgi:hypothetical protein